MNNLKKYRSLKGLTQSELAELAGISKFSVFNAENSKYHIHTMEKIAKSLDVSIFELLGNENLKVLPNNKEDYETILKYVEKYNDKF